MLVSEPTLSTITIALCLLGYAFAWKHYQKDKLNLALLFIVLSGLILRLYTSFDFYLHDWDEKYHALVAKNLINHPLKPTLYENPVLPYTPENWVGNHVWLHKQPLPLWLMAISLKIFGINELAIRIPSILLSTFGIGLVFVIGKHLFNAKTGLLAAFLFSINGLIIELAAGRVATDHVDISFMFFILLSVFLTIKLIQSQSWFFTFLIGLSIAGAILTKWLTGLIVIPIWLLLVLDSKRFTIKEIAIHFLVLTATVALTSIPWQVYIFNHFPVEAQHESSYNFRHLTEVIEGREGSVFYFIDRIRINYGELIYLPLIWMIWQFLKRKSFKLLALIVWTLVPLLIFSFAKTKMQAYLLFTAPALFLITAAFYFWLLEYKKGHKLKWLFQLILILTALLPLRYAVERVKPFPKTDRQPQWVVELKNLEEGKIKKGVLLNYENYIEAMFYTEFTTYPYIPQTNSIEQMLENGYTVWINDNGNLPDAVRNLKGVTIKSFKQKGEQKRN